MAIATLDDMLAGMQPPVHYMKLGVNPMEAAGTFHSPMYVGGLPGAMVAPTPGLAGAALTTYAGQLPFTNPVSGNSYLARLTCSSSIDGTLLLVDRLWHNSGIVMATTTLQTINSVAWPARDRLGSTNGDDVLIGLEVSTATGNGAANTAMTVGYTNSAGTAAKVATMGAQNPMSFPATAVAGTFVPFLLAAGDTGVRSVQDITLSTSLVSGTIHMVAYRVLAVLSSPVSNVGNAIDALTSGFPRLYNDTVPMFLWLPTSTSAMRLTGQMIVAQG